MAAVRLQHFAVRVDFDRAVETKLEFTGTKISDALILDVIAARDLPQEPNEFQRRHRFDYAHIKPPIVDDGLWGDESSPPD
jgi:hypothetical protein